MAKRTRSLRRTTKGRSLKKSPYKSLSKKKSNVFKLKSGKKLFLTLLFVASAVINVVVYSGLQDGSLVVTEVDTTLVVPIPVTKPSDTVLILSIVQLVLAILRIVVGVNSVTNINSIIAHSIIVVSLLANVLRLNLVRMVELYVGLDLIVNVYGALTSVFVIGSRFHHLFNFLVALAGIVLTANLIVPFL